MPTNILNTRTSKATKPHEEEIQSTPADVEQERDTVKPSLSETRQPDLDTNTPEPTPRSSTPSSPLTGAKIAAMRSPEPQEEISIPSPKPHTVEKTPRFSSRRQAQTALSKNWRVLVFMLVVVIVGVGLTVFFQNYTANNNGNNASSSSLSDASSSSAAPVEIAQEILGDESANPAPIKTSFDTKNVTVNAVGTAEEAAGLNSIDYAAFTSFSRFTWGFSDSNTPRATAVYNEANKEININFAPTITEDDKLLSTYLIGVGNAVSISGQNSTSQSLTTYTIKLISPLKFSLYKDENSIVLDLASDAQLASWFEEVTSSSTSSSVSTSSASSSTASSSTSTAASTSSSSSSAPTGKNLTNVKSQQNQTITNPGVVASNVKMQTYYYQDFGPYFSFSWAMQGTSDDNVPNVEAELINVDGQRYLQVVFNDLGQDVFYASGWSKASLRNINMQYANVMDVLFKGRNGNTSTYWIKLRRASDYRLYATTNQSQYRLVTVEMYD